MPPVKVPKHTEWKAVKKKYGVADGAVSGINLGKELDKYWAGKGDTLAAQQQLLTPLGVKMKTYITKLDKKKVKQYDAFQKDFLKNYLGAVHFLLEDIKRYKPTQDTYKKDLLKFFSMVQKLDAAKTTKPDLDKFRSGPVRGLAATGSQVRGVDATEINVIVNAMSDNINKMPNDIDRKGIATFVKSVGTDALKIQKIAKGLKLF